VHYVPEDGPDALAMINYTSGSTGNPKGVMIPYRAIVSNIIFARKAIPNIRGERVISILPMAHMYGMAFEFVYEMTEGAHIFFLTRIPSPKIIFKAFQEIKPVIVISVPLIIEKVMRKAVFPKINNTVKLLMKAPYLGGRIKAQICQQIKDAFGNNFREVIIGGAAFNQEIEKFLHDVHFPYTVGYGTTETAPILAYEDWSRFKPYSCGKAALNMELKIDSKDPERIVGEILAKGPNVMLGYYKNPEATAQVMRDGWYHTGDLGTIDAEGNLTIKGRCKNMLLSASGQNVYPEEIEDKLNTLPYVAECLVVQRGEKFFGLVYPDQDLVNKENLTDEKLQEIMENNRKLLNTLVANYEQLSGIEIQKEEFEKTAKKSIKRFLYS
jgi:long-chain acyl-CoA synthetase